MNGQDPKTDGGRVSELIARWQEGQRLGQSLTPAELCAETPDLLGEVEKQVAVLKEMDRFLCMRDSAGSQERTTVHEGRRAGDTPEPPQEARPRSLPIINGYDIHGELGRGGMGVVFKAWQLRLKRTVALKMILASDLAGQAEMKRFLAEAEAIAKLQHPNIVQIHEIAEADGKPFFCMEFVAGGSLAQKIAATPQPPIGSARLVEILARAMEIAHQSGIVHRDLKPANVLLTTEGTPKIADFGLAKHLEPDVQQSRSGSIVGTPSYMAPEQAAGRTRDVGPISDVYALGAILYEMLTGRPPFRAETAWDTIQQVVSIDPVSPSRLQPTVPRDLETICLKCLEKQPTHRYSSAQALADDLRKYIAGEPILARPISSLERLGKWCRRRPAVATLLTGFLLSLFLGVSGILWKWSEAEESRRHAEKKEVLERQAKENANELAGKLDKELDRSQSKLYLTRVSLAHREWLASNVERTRRLLDLCPTELRNWEWGYVDRLCRSDFPTLEHSAIVNTCQFHPDGVHLLSASRNGKVQIWNILTGKEGRSLPGHEGRAYIAVFSPDGKTCASSGEDGQVRVWDWEDGRLRFEIGGFDKFTLALAYSPDGMTIAAPKRKDKELAIFDVKDGKLIRTTSLQQIGVNCFAYSQDGNRFAAGFGDIKHGVIRIWDFKTDKLLHILRGHVGDVSTVAFSPDGQFLASGGWDRTVRVWNVNSGEQVYVYRGHSDWVHRIAFSSDGRYLASVSDDRTVKVINPHTGEEIRTLRGHRDKVNGVAFSKNGAVLASCGFDHTVRLWDLNKNQEFMSLRGHPSRIRTFAFGDGGDLFAGAYENTITVWNARTGEVLRESKTSKKKASKAGITCIVFHPRMRQIASCSAQSIRVEDVDNGNETGMIRGHPGNVTDAAFNPAGELIATVDDGGTVRIWHLAEQRLLFETGGPPGTAKLFFSQDGTRLVAVGGKNLDDGEVWVWDVAEKRKVTSYNTSSKQWWVSFTSAGPKILIHVPGAMRVIDPVSGNEVSRFPVDQQTMTFADMHPSGFRVALVGSDRIIRLVDALTGEEILAFPRHENPAVRILFSPSGTGLVSIGNPLLLGPPAEVRLWNGDFDHK